MISKAFKLLENAHKIGTCIHYIKEYLVLDIRNDEEFYGGDVSTFMDRAT
jgi:hypothetical protein